MEIITTQKVEKLSSGRVTSLPSTLHFPVEESAETWLGGKITRRIQQSGVSYKRVQLLPLSH